jgi:hypothetical protein
VAIADESRGVSAEVSSRQARGARAATYNEAPIRRRLMTWFRKRQKSGTTLKIAIDCKDSTKGLQRLTKEVERLQVALERLDIERLEALMNDRPCLKS